MNSKYSVGPYVVQMCHICMLMAYWGIIFKHNKNITMFQNYCRHCSTEVLQKLSCDDIHLFTESLYHSDTRRKYL